MKKSLTILGVLCSLALILACAGCTQVVPPTAPTNVVALAEGNKQITVSR